jgi:hypothetical protein
LKIIQKKPCFYRQVFELSVLTNSNFNQNNNTVNETYIEKNDIIGRYVRNELSVREANLFRLYLLEHPEVRIMVAAEQTKTALQPNQSPRQTIFAADFLHIEIFEDWYADKLSEVQTYLKAFAEKKTDFKTRFVDFFVKTKK